MSAMFGVALDGRETPDEALVFAALADQAGARSLFVSCHLFQREPAVVATLALAATRRLGATLMAISPYSVHPVYAAMTAATLDEYFPGRVQLCFGVGAPKDLEAAGIAVRDPVGTLREAIEIARRLLAGERVEFQGERYRLTGRALVNAPRPVPIWLAASGPRMLALAGAAADGVLISGGTAPAFVRWSLDHVRRGEAAAGRTVRKASLVYASVDDDARAAHDRLRRRLAFVLRGAHHAHNLALAGSTLDQAALADAFARDDGARIDALITDAVMRNHTASGTPAEVRASFARYRAIGGLDEIVIAGVADSAMLRRVLAVALEKETG
jgi:5,10-methylenetetrahydromethanopterin reductase